MRRPALLLAVAPRRVPGPRPRAPAVAQRRPATVPPEHLRRGARELCRRPPMSAPSPTSNGDGRDEALVSLQSGLFCGSGGCALYIYTPAGASGAQVAELTIVNAPVRLLEHAEPRLARPRPSMSAAAASDPREGDPLRRADLCVQPIAWPRAPRRPPGRVLIGDEHREPPALLTIADDAISPAPCCCRSTCSAASTIRAGRRAGTRRWRPMAGLCSRTGAAPVRRSSMSATIRSARLIARARPLGQ